MNFSTYGGDTSSQGVASVAYREAIESTTLRRGLLRLAFGEQVYKEYLATICPDGLHDCLELRAATIQVRLTAGIPAEVAATLKDRPDQIANAVPGRSDHTMNRESFYLCQFVGKGLGIDDPDGWLLNEHSGPTRRLLRPDVLLSALFAVTRVEVVTKKKTEA